MSTAFDYTERPTTAPSNMSRAEVRRYEVGSRTTGELLPDDNYVAHFSSNVLNSPMFDGKDVAGLIGAACMTLGPLAAYSFGLGL